MSHKTFYGWMFDHPLDDQAPALVRVG